VLRACATGSTRGSGELAAALADVVQEVFSKAFAPDVRRRFDENRPYEPYLGQITRNVAIDHWRQMRRYVPSDLEQLIEKLSFEEAETNPGNDWSDPDTIAVVERYLASLDRETRLVHEALYVKGMSQREAAAVLGLGRQAIRSKEAKLRRELRRELSRAERAIPLPFRSTVSKETG
jgi:RNA polymerase sigma factor (sigma-70 family)